MYDERGCILILIIYLSGTDWQCNGWHKGGEGAVVGGGMM